MKLSKVNVSGRNDELLYENFDERVAIYKNYNGYIYIVLYRNESFPKNWVGRIKICNVDLYADIFHFQETGGNQDYTFIKLDNCYVIHINNFEKIQAIVNEHKLPNTIFVDFEMIAP